MIDRNKDMWKELESYQPFADHDGHGVSWKRMCEEKTIDAAMYAAQDSCMKNTFAWEAATTAAQSLFDWQSEAIKAIDRAKKGMKSS
jgi:hypothetical protein